MTSNEHVDGAKVETAAGHGDTVKWRPVAGEELERLELPAGAEDQIRSAAFRILGSCVCPDDKATVESNVGLVVGYVQSGKTATFISTIAMARDNGFALVILLAGASVNLVDQTRRRVLSKKGLGIADRDDRQWVHIPFDVKSPEYDGSKTKGLLRAYLDDWRDSNLLREEQRTVLITVMKHHSHLSDLASALAAVRSTGELDRVPALVIDDEADQISLNAKAAKGEESTNYGEIIALRQVLPWHTYLQVTATPQAPLLVQLADRLSPDFVKVLSPGPGYVGGTTFFPPTGGGGRSFVTSIPDDEQFTIETLPEVAPPSFREALAQFVVSAAAWQRALGTSGNCSMMIHPDRQTAIHRRYHVWVKNLLKDWNLLLGRPHDDDFDDMLTVFRERYHNLALTWAFSKGIPAMPSFEQVVSRIERVLKKVRITQVNAAKSGQTPRIHWKQEQCHILVGGQALDRGYTVEGLIITYMPRSLGVGNADTLQQRARFFGYKKDYLGFCRMWLPPDVIQGFRNYVEHEEQMRAQLLKLEREGRNLADWKRALLLDSSLRPTRRSVIGMKLSTVRIQNWVTVDYLGLSVGANGEPIGQHMATSNTLGKLAEALRSHNQLEPAVQAGGSSMGQHLAARITCQELLDWTSRLSFADERDSDPMFAAQLSLKAWSERPGNECSLDDIPCDVLIMGPGFKGSRRRKQRADGRLTLMQGRSEGANPYPGDAAFTGRDPNDDIVCLQLHRLRVTTEQGILEGIWTCALHLPEERRSTWVMERR